MPHRPRVLIVEDDPSQRTVLANWLQWEGLSVDAADEPPEALALVHSERPYDVLVCDVMMFGFGGERDALRDLIGEARARSPRAFVLLVSGLDADTLAARAPAVGANAWLEKPLDAGRIVQAVMDHLRKRG